MNIAKGIDGIRGFLKGKAKEQTSGWHVFESPMDSNPTFSTKTAETIIREMSAQGYTFIGWTGNGLVFDI